MGFFGGIGKAIKGVGRGAAGAMGMGHGTPPPTSGSAVGAGPGFGAGLAGAGMAMGQQLGGPASPAIANENQRTLMGGGMSELQAIQAANGPAAPGGFIQRGQRMPMPGRMPLPSGGFGRSAPGAPVGGGWMGGVGAAGGTIGGGLRPTVEPPGVGMDDESTRLAPTGGFKPEKMAPPDAPNSGLEGELMKRQAMGSM